MSRFSIMVASDLSDRSERALRRAFKLAQHLDADLTLYSVVDDATPTDWVYAAVARSTDYLTAFGAELRSDVTPKIVVETGDPMARLLDMATDPAFDLVIFGRHRKRPILDGFRKTTVESIAALSLTPLLIAVEPPHEPYSRVLVPTAFSHACRRAVEAALRLAPGADLRMIHAWMAPFEGMTGGRHSDYAKTVNTEVSAQAAQWSEGLPNGVPPVTLMQGALGRSVFETLDRFKPDLLALGAHTRSVAFSGLGSFTNELLRNPPTDLLITRGVDR